MTRLEELRAEYKQYQTALIIRFAANKRHRPMDVNDLKEISKKVRGRADKVANKLIEKDFEQGRNVWALAKTRLKPRSRIE